MRSFARGGGEPEGSGSRSEEDTRSEETQPAATSAGPVNLHMQAPLARAVCASIRSISATCSEIACKPEDWVYLTLDPLGDSQPSPGSESSDSGAAHVTESPSFVDHDAHSPESPRNSPAARGVRIRCA